MKIHRRVICLLLLLVAAPSVAAAGPTTAPGVTAPPSGDMADIYRAMRDGKLPLLPGQPVYVHSQIDKKRLQADVYGIVPYTLADLSRALANPCSWCQFVTLHLNVKACTCRLEPHPVLTVYAGRKFYEAPEDATRMDYRFRVVEQSNRRLVILLTAARGELSTRDHRFRVEAERINTGDVLLHFSLSYRQSLASRMATRAYLSTLGREKVGFSRQAEGATRGDYIGGLRGIVERNAMRYFLALTVFMDTLGETGPGVQSRRIRQWYDLTQRYATQLHEVDRTDYLIDKHREFENQEELQSLINSAPPAAAHPNDS